MDEACSLVEAGFEYATEMMESKYSEKESSLSLPLSFLSGSACPVTATVHLAVKI
jgi:hypothetical protein